jgi:hypothetical protein
MIGRSSMGAPATDAPTYAQPDFDGRELAYVLHALGEHVKYGLP